MKNADRLLVAGADLGKATIRLVLAAVEPDGSLGVLAQEATEHGGEPLEAFSRLYREHDVARAASLAVTGLYGTDLGAPARFLPEEACLEAGADKLIGADGPLNLVQVGARGYSVLTREIGPDGRARVQYVENEKCSSGTGENMVKIAGRFGLTIEEAGRLAMSANSGIPITARCSVFAKSEMTHFANEGKPRAELFRGYFESVARNAAGMLARNRVPGPVHLVGGCARIEAFREALGEVLGDAIQVPADMIFLEALGAARLAAEQAAHGPGAELPTDPTALFIERGPRFSVLPPASEQADKVTQFKAPRRPAKWKTRPVILGVDLGSTGAKAALIDVKTGALLHDVYDRTRGNPVEATQRLVRTLLDDLSAPDVRAIALTGSGRMAAATLIRAIYPAEQILVLNEIVAHARAAAECDVDGGADLSVIEIGGQDAKYIRLRDGRIVDSDMNKACSAGTGSFLEEQAQFYEVQDIAEMTARASRAQRPPDLGQMCTVYVADAASLALKEGFELDDLLAGFQYSVIHNYLNRVMGQRQLASRVFLQGKPATNLSLAWTLATVTGREIVVPANPGVMGAWGIGLNTIDERGAEALLTAPRLALGRILEASITARQEFQCKHGGCQTLCPIERTTIDVGGDEVKALSGGACPKYEVAVDAAAKLPMDAPNPFRQRLDLYRGLLENNPRRADAPRIAVPLTGPLQSELPWIVTLLQELGCAVELLETRRDSLARGEQLCNSFDACGPTKIAHALVEQVDASLIFFPQIRKFADRDHIMIGNSCLTEQAMPDIVAAALKSQGSGTRVIRPVLDFAGTDGTSSFGRALLAWRALRPVLGGAGLAALGQVVRAAQRAQQVREQTLQTLADLGRAAMTYAAEQDLPVVVLCGPLHVIHDPVLAADIPRALRANGALPIPMDTYPVPADTPPLEKRYWGDANRAVRVAAAARSAGDAYPVMLTSFGCGPASFVEHFFSELVLGYPHTILETDGHGGTAGFVTRVQAFLHAVRQHREADGGSAGGLSPRAVAILERSPRRRYLDPDVRYLFISASDYLGDLFAAVYRSYGYDAVAAPPISEEGLHLGQQDCSGKECISYQLVWGAFRQALEAGLPEGREVRLMQISGEMCRGGVFAAKDRLALEHLGYSDRVSVSAIKLVGSIWLSARTWWCLAGLDIIRQLYVYYLAVIPDRARAEAVYHEASQALIELCGRRQGTGRAEALSAAREWRALRRLIDDTGHKFLELVVTNGRRLPRIFVSGDLLTKGNDVANGGIYNLLADRGVQPIVEPMADFLEFLALAHPPLLFGRNASRLQGEATRYGMIATRTELYHRARKLDPWLPVPQVTAALKRSDGLLHRSTLGGSPYAVGSVLHAWDSGEIDGALLTSCWGCDNGLVEESLLRHSREIPFYFYYDDATPIDERRIESFVHRLRRQAGLRERQAG